MAATSAIIGTHRPHGTALLRYRGRSRRAFPRAAARQADARLSAEIRLPDARKRSRLVDGAAAGTSCRAWVKRRIQPFDARVVRLLHVVTRPRTPDRHALTLLQRLGEAVKALDARPFDVLHGVFVSP
ncbi:MAG: hypothetical protein E5W59_15555 [Mesorhizobium sp.]|nr:MAG: hypothetical protein E5W59_15555 [Mesorhizobium sp.]